MWLLDLSSATIHPGVHALDVRELQEEVKTRATMSFPTNGGANNLPRVRPSTSAHEEVRVLALPPVGPPVAAVKPPDPSFIQSSLAPPLLPTNSLPGYTVA